MVSLTLILIAACVFILLLLIIYALMYSREGSKLLPVGENQRLIYSTQPLMSIITKQMPYPTHDANSASSSDLNLNKQKFNPMRSQSLANNLCITKTPCRRRSSIIDSKEIAQIEFSLPPTAEKYRRRSLAICNNIIESKNTTIDSIIRTMESKSKCAPCLCSFSLHYFESSQIKIDFRSLTVLRSATPLQQLTIEVKMIPDGKTKCLALKKVMGNENVFAQKENESLIQFSNVAATKLQAKSLLMKFHGKDQAKKTIQFGQIGKIYFNQIDDVGNGNPLEFTHEIEIIRMSSVEVLVRLEQNDDRCLTVGIERIKGLKIDQKCTTTHCYFQVILLDRHRPLTMYQTKLHRLNASAFSIDEAFDFNILAFNSNNRDRIMIMINLYSNSHHATDYRCIARVKIGSSYFCSGSGIMHWQQLKERQSYSMWHKFIKQC